MRCRSPPAARRRSRRSSRPSPPTIAIPTTSTTWAAVSSTTISGGAASCSPTRAARSIRSSSGTAGARAGSSASRTLPFFPALWLAHQRYDDYWKHGSVCEDFAAIELPGARDRRLDGRLHQRRAAAACRAQGAAARHHRSLGPSVSARRRAGTGDRLLAGGGALVGSVAEGPGHRDHEGADAAGLHRGSRATRGHAHLHARALGGRALVPVSRRPPQRLHLRADRSLGEEGSARARDFAIRSPQSHGKAAGEWMGVGCPGSSRRISGSMTAVRWCSRLHLDRRARCAGCPRAAAARGGRCAGRPAGGAPLGRRAGRASDARQLPGAESHASRQSRASVRPRARALLRRRRNVQRLRPPLSAGPSHPALDRERLLADRLARALRGDAVGAHGRAARSICRCAGAASGMRSPSSRRPTVRSLP